LRIPFQGKDIEVQEVEVIASNEPWSEYQLADGKVLSSKTILISVFRAIEERGPDGEFIYITRTQNILKVK